MAARVTRGFHHPRRAGTERDGIAGGDRLVQLRQPVRIGGGAHHFGAVARANLVCAGDVVAVVMGEQDHVQSAASGIDGSGDRGDFGGVNDRGGTRGGALQQPGVIVGQDGHGSCFDHGRRVHQVRVGAQTCYTQSMATDVQAATEFYASRRGAVAARLLRARLALLWPSLAGQSVLGLGYAAPYLRLWREDARHCIAMTPSQIGIARWPAGAPNLTCTADEHGLPFADSSFDRVLVVHALESAERVGRMLREVWRVLKDDGRLVIVAPNRAGLWAHTEGTPFGQGQPFSPGQIDRLLRETLFHVERRDMALFVPPVDWRVLLRSAPFWETAGRRLLPGFAGVTITEASKDIYAVMPIEGRLRRTILAEAA